LPEARDLTTASGAGSISSAGLIFIKLHFDVRFSDFALI
jgi:hypothetical protein